jgi:glycosyltransferase involved in cell wall biosynthesis
MADGADPHPPPATAARVLIAVPAFNEEQTLAGVIGRIRATLPEHDLLVVNDGSRDATARILAEQRVTTASHLCNLGYGRAIQTALLYAWRHDYDVLVTLDADGQHQPEQVRDLLAALARNGWDVCLGSRYRSAQGYRGAPLGRRAGMLTFSLFVGLVTGQRIWDTTSGLRALRRPVFEPLARWHFIDFHAEAIVYLMRLGYRIGEHPITVDARRHGRSMYSLGSAVKYPLKTLLMVLLGLSQAALARARR